MKKPAVEATNAENLEERFDRGEDVLDYFDKSKIKMVESKTEVDGIRKNPADHVIVREEPPE